MEKKFQQMRGFTLIELMVAIGIMAILATIAVPSFQRYITKGRLEEGKAALAQNALWLDKMYNKYHAYKIPTASGSATRRFIVNSDLPISQTGNGNNGYTFSLTKTCNSNDAGTDDAEFCLIATPQARQANAGGGGKECGKLMVNQAGKYQVKIGNDIKANPDDFKCF